MFVGTNILDDDTDCWRGYIDFFIDNSTETGIQDDDIITDMTLFTTQSFDFGLTDCDVRHINGTGIVPVTTNGTDAQMIELWINLGNGTEFVTDDTFCDAGVDVKTSVNLGTDAIFEMQKALNQTDPFLENLFSVSILAGNETLDSSGHILFMYTKNEVADILRRPILQLTYNTTHHFAGLTDSLGLEDPFGIPTFSQTIDLTPIDDSGEFPFQSQVPYRLLDGFDASNNLCDDNDNVFGTGNPVEMGWFAAADAGNDCFVSLLLWDIDPIPDGAIILNVSTVLKGQFAFDGIQLINNACVFRHIETFPEDHGAQDIGAVGKSEDVKDGEIYLTDTECSVKLGLGTGSGDTPEPAVEFNLGNATADLQFRLGKGSNTTCGAGCTGFDWFGLGLDFDRSSKNGTFAELQRIRGDNAILRIKFMAITDPVDDLTGIGRINDVDLDWSAPQTYGYTNITGYQINFTTPAGNPPLTVVINDTGSTTTDALITGLEPSTAYTFRVKVYDDSGTFIEVSNSANATTGSLGNFTIGTVGDTSEFTLNATQADARDIKYIRTDVTDTQTLLEVIHPNSFNLQCDMYFKLALSNQNFTGLTTVPEGATEKKATFTFNNQQNDIIEVTCFDTATNVSADYLIVQRQFLLLDQFNMFRDGTYGTQGQFGSIDLITLGAVIVAMIGFNRVNETVGAIFTVVILGMLSFFEIVVWQTFMFGTVAAVLMLVIASTRKV